MKKSMGMVVAILLATSAVFAIKTEGERSVFQIDTKASKVYWTGKKVTGEHTGYLSVGDGTIAVNNNSVVSAQVIMDLKTIVCTDIETGNSNNKLVGHLKSEDFFSVEKHPNATFDITSVKAIGNAGEYNVTGNLTIKGITNEISFPSKIKVENGKVSAQGTAKIDRTKWNIRYGSGKFFEGLGDKMIYDEFEITFDIAAKSADNGLTSR